MVGGRIKRAHDGWPQHVTGAADHGRHGGMWQHEACTNEPRQGHDTHHGIADRLMHNLSSCPSHMWIQSSKTTHHGIADRLIEADAQPAVHHLPLQACNKAASTERTALCCSL